MNWAARVGALALVGTEAFGSGRVGPAPLAAELVAFAVAIAALVLWALGESVPSFVAQWARLLPYVLTVVAVSSAVAALARTGGLFIGLSFMATIAAGSQTSAATGWAVTLSGILAVVSVGFASGDHSTWQVLGDVLFLLVGLLLGRNRRGYRVQAEQNAALLAKAEQFQEEHSRAAALAERNRIAREIHDVLAHSLGALGLQIQAARAVLTDQQDVGHAIELLDQAKRMANDGLDETRRAVNALRADTPELPEGLADLSAAHRARHGARVTFQVTGARRALSADAGLALTRAAQEALVNAAKHAPHQPVEVRLKYEQGRTALIVANKLCDNAGGQATTFETVNGGRGLPGMRERLLLIDGSLSAGRRDGQWVVSAQVPQ